MPCKRRSNRQHGNRVNWSFGNHKASFWSSRPLTGAGIQETGRERPTGLIRVNSHPFGSIRQKYTAHAGSFCVFHFDPRSDLHFHKSKNIRLHKTSSDPQGPHPKTELFQDNRETGYDQTAPQGFILVSPLHANLERGIHTAGIPSLDPQSGIYGLRRIRWFPVPRCRNQFVYPLE